MSIEIKTTAETEVAIYCKIANIEGLKEACSKELQLQAEIKASDKGKIRVRRVTKDNIISYTQTIKEKPLSDQSLVDTDTEITMDISEEMFSSFFHIAERRQNKTRYFFIHKGVSLNLHDDVLKSIELPEIIFEVDVYTKKDGTTCEYCKIDVELDKVLSFLNQNYPELKDLNLRISVRGLPINPIEPFITDNATPEQKIILDNLYKNEFNV